ncbi:MAG: hypothetical protein ACI9WU_003655 [Myxococcota bacterium]|jgi:hypothetical protein
MSNGVDVALVGSAGNDGYVTVYTPDGVQV